MLRRRTNEAMVGTIQPRLAEVPVITRPVSKSAATDFILSEFRHYDSDRNAIRTGRP